MREQQHRGANCIEPAEHQTKPTAQQPRKDADQGRCRHQRQPLQWPLGKAIVIVGNTVNQRADGCRWTILRADLSSGGETKSGFLENMAILYATVTALALVYNKEPSSSI